MPLPPISHNFKPTKDTQTLVQTQGIQLRDYVIWIAFALLLPAVNQFAQARTSLSNIAESGQSDVVRQIVIVVLMLASLFVFIKRKSIGSVIHIIPISMIALFAWAAITLTWSPVPDIGLRRLIFTLLVTMTVLCVTQLASPMKILQRYREVAVAFSILSILLVIAAPSLAIHQSGDGDLAGDWRGVFYHKNIFGSVLTPAILIIWFEIISRKRARILLTSSLLMMLFLLWQTGSKTSAVLVLALMAFLWAIKMLDSRSGGLKLASFFALTAGAAAAWIFAVWLVSRGQTPLLQDSDFTNRAYIWRSLLNISQDSPIGGIGYQSVFFVGTESKLQMLAPGLSNIAHAHNVYIEMLVSMGWIGLIVFLFAIVIVPVIETIKAPRTATNERLLCLTLIMFTWLHGMLESGLFDRARIGWIVFLIAYGALLQIKSTAPRSSRAEQPIHLRQGG